MIFAKIGLFLLFVLVGVGEYLWISSELSGSCFLVAVAHALVSLFVFPKLYSFGLTQTHGYAYILYGIMVCIVHAIKDEGPYRFCGGSVALLDLAFALVILLNGSVVGDFIVTFLCKGSVIFFLPLLGLALLLI